MATKIKHVWIIPKEDFIWYLETLGVSTQEIKDIEESFESKIEVEHFDELQLIGNWIHIIPDSSLQLIPYLNNILECVCSMKTNNVLKKIFTIESIKDIINRTIDYIITSKDETLNFDKINEILLMILQELNKLLNDLLSLQKFKDYYSLPTSEVFLKLLKINPILTCILTIISNLHIKKLSIFIEGTNQINIKELQNATTEIIASMKIQEISDKNSKKQTRKPKNIDELKKRTPYI